MTIVYVLCLTDLEIFLTSHKEQWENKQTEVEAKFLELSSLADEISNNVKESRLKKRKRSAKAAHFQGQDDPFASYAATLQVDFFRKVLP